ncbi:COP9 signalosome, subunit CSN8 [Penicillium expansum]|uniref:COP9 signalosome complex subunit 8 n=1 Tax=Penicillium expansum TaxID=27334 RepID=A0A0A2IW25_PENEN|nr:COP9 signalosome, subunit CSN8 [Penicillium expansum]KAJ5492476.1 COP9 signalosome subunit CSN8 [Penicillium expansum]KGO47269.1 COP9 signalosome, subunit CSN8 [Penicillium expansum]KGO58069.1 COP9 signalosome, subunit CSN8 [Penicillium expansum]KGO58093.1 COP9 signalosome, subunit CSN8 [Penicillium expansum]
MELPPLTMEQLSQLVASNAPPSQLFEALSRYELQACLIYTGDNSASTDGADSTLLSLFYSSFFLVHLLTDQVSEARALTKRIPEALLQQDPSLQNCLALLRAVWQTQHGQVYQVLRGLPWPDVLQPLVRRYESFFQDKTLIAVSRSYEAIRLATAATHLGLDEQLAKQEDPNIISNFTKCGWTWDPESKLLHPKPIVVSTAEPQSSNGISKAMAMLGTRAG